VHAVEADAQSIFFAAFMWHRGAGQKSYLLLQVGKSSLNSFFHLLLTLLQRCYMLGPERF